jgi:16S rRNA (uracil1498-N3)-methyltransferase
VGGVPGGAGNGGVLITLLTDPAGFDGPEIRVEGDAYRHLFRARRVEVGAAMRVVDGRGRARWGEVSRVDRSSALVRLGGAAPGNEPAYRLEILAPTFRLERASWLVEKATEVGVSAVRFVQTSRAPREFGEGTLDRLRRVAVAALEQCHRALLPEISGPHAWREAVPLALEGRWVLDTESASAGWGEVAGASGTLLVGPEGGWSPEERQDLRGAGFRAVGLGERVLRVETAALVGAAALLLPLNPGAVSGTQN